jgi:hypothetical protein
MHRSRDIQVEIFEPWDRDYFQALSTSEQAETCEKLVKTQFFMVLSTKIPVLRIFCVKNMQKNPFGEGQVKKAGKKNDCVPGKSKYVTGELYLNRSSLRLTSHLSVFSKFASISAPTDQKIFIQTRDYLFPWITEVIFEPRPEVPVMGFEPDPLQKLAFILANKGILKNIS